MKTRIANVLIDAAKDNEIEILFACESGSRAWGFPSPDSDFDVRFIYKRKEEDYTKLFTSPDQISFPITDELDLYGWDIKKVLQLLYKSNCTPFEWIQSPIVYDKRNDFKEEFMTLLPYFFDVRKQMFHYLGIAKGAMESMSEREIKIKKLFYVLRPLLAAKWIAEKRAYAPMNIVPLLTLLSDDLSNKISNVITEKASRDESFLIEIDASILDFIHSEMEILTAFASELDKTTFDSQKLENYFIKCIKN